MSKLLDTQTVLQTKKLLEDLADSIEGETTQTWITLQLVQAKLQRLYVLLLQGDAPYNSAILEMVVHLSSELSEMAISLTTSTYVLRKMSARILQDSSGTFPNDDIPDAYQPDFQVWLNEAMKRDTDD
jgi:hypothetical protein